jgi:hypothetical protein
MKKQFLDRGGIGQVLGRSWAPNQEPSTQEQQTGFHVVLPSKVKRQGDRFQGTSWKIKYSWKKKGQLWQKIEKGIG